MKCNEMLTDNARDFFSTYLSARKQKVAIGRINSSYSNINCGVPQGSGLCLILSSLYINALKDMQGNIISNFDDIVKATEAFLLTCTVSRAANLRSFEVVVNRIQRLLL